MYEKQKQSEFYSYYQDELKYLTDLGKDYAERWPDNAAFLSSGAASDPDVERLLQGFSFLTARLHQRLDNQFSEIAEGFLSMLWPQYLTPTPAIAMIEFIPDSKLVKNVQTINKNAVLHTKAYSWGRCDFRTCHPVILYPFRLANVVVESRANRNFMQLNFDLNPGSNMSESELDSLQIHLFHTDRRLIYDWYLWLTQYVKHAKLKADTGELDTEITLSPVGFESNDAFLPTSLTEPQGFRTLREFTSYSQRFFTVQIDSLKALKNIGESSSFQVIIDFGDQMPTGKMKNIDVDFFRLFCVPAVNLFQTSANVNHDYTRREYPLRTNQDKLENYEVFSTNNVFAIEEKTGKRIDYHPYFSMKSIQEQLSNRTNTYRTRFIDIQAKKNNQNLTGRDCLISFQESPENEFEKHPKTVTIDLISTNRQAATKLSNGDICRPSEDIPALTSFRDIGKLNPQIDTPQAGSFYWLLISSLAISRETMQNLDNLKSLIKLYTQGKVAESSLNRMLSCLVDLNVQNDVVIITGYPCRCLNVQFWFDIEPERFAESYLFGRILFELLRSAVSINTRINVTIRNTRKREIAYTWPSIPGIKQDL
jgi:type VI secretion system protein ImpG